MADKTLTIEDFALTIRNTALKAVGEFSNVSDFLYKFVHLLSGDIVIVKDPNEYEENGGSLTINEDDSFLIRLPPFTSPIRDNFTIAHELGHYFIHYMGDKTQNVFYRYGTGPQEVTANKFAAAFLMPKNDFQDKAKEFNNSVLKLAAFFQVSTSAVENRIKSLKI